MFRRVIIPARRRSRCGLQQGRGGVRRLHREHLNTFFDVDAHPIQVPWSFVYARCTSSQPETTLIDTHLAPYAALLLRVCLAAAFIAHAMLKVRVFTIPSP